MTQRFGVYICVGIMLTYLTSIQSKHMIILTRIKNKLLWYFIILFDSNTIHGNIMICDNFKGKNKNKSENNMKYLIFILFMVACKNLKITFFGFFNVV